MIKSVVNSQNSLLEVWKQALIGGQTGFDDPLDVVVQELSEYFHLPETEVRKRCVHWEDDSVVEWKARDRSTREGLLDFYQTQTSWIFDTMWYHAQQYHGDKIAESVIVADGMKHLPAGKHLDFGSGPGSSSLFFHKLGWEVSLADVSTTMMDFARWRLARHGVTAPIYDTAHEALPEATFDLITAFDVIVHVPDVAATLAQLNRALRPDGHLVFNIDDRPMTERTAWHLYSEQYLILRQVRQAGFERLPKIDFFHVYRKVERSPEETRRVASEDARRYNAAVATVGKVIRRLGLRH
jgi:2-polyprenyl-3-methyl-5-hydroxy-6-metoxy-1,4-benzoquinol methylase